MLEQIYKRSWELLKERLEKRTVLSKEQLERLMAECFEEAVNKEVGDRRL